MRLKDQMTKKHCVEKNCCGKSVRKYTLTTAGICTIMCFTAMAVRPQDFLLLDAFVVAQVASVGLMILLKLADLCCMCCGLSDRLQLSVLLVLTCIYLNATVCGFLHPDISFETHIVEVPVDEDTSAFSGSNEMMPMTAPGTEIVD